MPTYSITIPGAGARALSLVAGAPARRPAYVMYVIPTNTPTAGDKIRFANRTGGPNLVPPENYADPTYLGPEIDLPSQDSGRAAAPLHLRYTDELHAVGQINANTGLLVVITTDYPALV